LGLFKIEFLKTGGFSSEGKDIIFPPHKNFA